MATQTYTEGEMFAALLVAVLFGLVGAGFCHFVSYGITLPQRFFNGYKIKAPSGGYFKLPTLLGMIIFALIARNYFGQFMEAFPDTWG
jgi:hypothetical protein